MFERSDEVWTAELCWIVLHCAQRIPEDDGIYSLEIGCCSGKERIADENGRRVVQVGKGCQTQPTPLVTLNVRPPLVKVLPAQRLVRIGSANQIFVRIILKK